MDLELVLFDLDGTLIEFHHEYLFSETERILRLFDREVVSRETMSTHFRAFDYFAFLEEEGREAFVEEFWQQFDWDSFPAPMPILGAEDALTRLFEADVCLSIVTARVATTEQLNHTLERAGFGRFFDHVFSRAGDHIAWWDKTETIQRACRELGIPPEKAMMIGDIPTDVSSAKEVKVAKQIAVLSGGIDIEILRAAEPDSVLTDVGELPTYLKL